MRFMMAMVFATASVGLVATALAEVPELAKVGAVVPRVITVNAPTDQRCRFVNDVLQGQLERVLTEGGLKMLPSTDIERAPNFTMVMVADLPNPKIPSAKDRCLVTAEAALTVPLEPPVGSAVVELWRAAPVLGEVLAGRDAGTPSAELADQAQRFVDGFVKYFFEQRGTPKAP